jgi:Mrp family chromosome partitioning ATPase
MSRNFELLTQLEPEHESSAPDKRIEPAPAGPVAQEVAPFLATNRPSIPSGEEIQRLVQRIFLSGNGNAPRQVVLCGVDYENSSSSVCASIGRTLAAYSSRAVCLLDANVRAARLSHIFGIDGTKPACDNSSMARAHCVQVDSNLLLAGPSLLTDESGVLLPIDNLMERLNQLREIFEYVMIDAPGTSVCGDAQLLCQIADATILVIEANVTRRLTARKAKDTLQAAGVRLLGTILNGRSFPIPDRIYKRV